VVETLDKEEYVVIDIRGEEETFKSSFETLNIPFYKLKTEFKKLPQDKEYLLYCEKGVMSQLHAQYLRDSEKRENVKVYRP
jgi:thiamine biosynthesis protein ThiI